MIGIALVDACVRDPSPGHGNGRGGSPTAVVVDDAAATDAERRRTVVRARVSHGAFLDRTPRPDGSTGVRFFTSAGELAGCGHGTVAAQAVILQRLGVAEHRGRQHTGGRTFDTVASRRAAGIEVWFDQGVVALRPPAGAELDALLAALGIRRGELHPDDQPVVATPGTPRLLVPVADREVLLSVTPCFDRLGSECHRLGQLGCFVYVPPTPTEPAAARMFAPAIGVPEDVANANSTGCLAAHLLANRGTRSVEVEQGDALGRPSTVFASAEPAGDGFRTRVGGRAVVRRSSG